MRYKCNRTLGTRLNLALLAILCADAAALGIALIISIIARFNTIVWSKIFANGFYLHAPELALAGLVYFCAFSALRLYRYVWRFAGLETIRALVIANSIGVASLVLIELIHAHTEHLGAGLITFWALGIIFTGGIRLLLRKLDTPHQSLKDQIEYSSNGCRKPKRAVIMGAGANGARILKTVCEDPTLQYNVIGFLDDDPAKQQVFVGNAKVIGPLDDLDKLVASDLIDELIVAIPHIDEQRLRKYVIECRKRKLPVKLVPQISDVLNGKSHVHLVDFQVEDLLRRKPADKCADSTGSYLNGKRVLVTGAGGSIGSELCRQIVSMNPASLILLGHGENSIHQIVTELSGKCPSMSERIQYAIGSVAHKPRVEQVFRQFEPQVVFHTAAHKHVPMMEINEQEAVRNNVLGTFNVAEACGKIGVERVVLISTDKAADPCSVMGSTKRLCEEIQRSAAQMWPETSFVTVRFGNVLGSRGSVVSIFRKQIENGGPVKVTHKDMTRYFMTIPEAVRLVLQAGAVGSSGELYLLEMGKPIKVLDLALDMIRLSGLEPYVDIKIDFTGMRPGEKLHESLTSADEKIARTQCEGLSIISRPQHIGMRDLLQVINRLEHSADHGSATQIRNLLREYVPGCLQDIESQPIEQETYGLQTPAQSVVTG